jgi:hypothetical protein
MYIDAKEQRIRQCRFFPAAASKKRNKTKDVSFDKDRP